MLSEKHASCARPFYNLMDDEAVQLRNHHDNVIANLMDLSTIKVEAAPFCLFNGRIALALVLSHFTYSPFQKKIDGAEYPDVHSFAADVRLIFSNCYKCCPSHLEVVAQARKLQVSSYMSQIYACICVCECMCVLKLSLVFV